MTMSRFMWIFVAIGAGALLLAGAGQWLLDWNRDGVQTWLGIGVGYLLAYGHLPLARGWAGPQAFWGMSALAMGLVAAVFLLLLRRVAKAEQAD